MREILFRGKTEQGEWVYGFYHNETSIESPSSDRKITRHHIYTQDFDKFVIPETVGQFTGLTDKNGKKIFEGDIVKIRRAYLNAGYEEDCFYKVAWHKYWNGWALINIRDTQSCYLDNVIQGEVIGNIHDNPELLGE